VHGGAHHHHHHHDPDAQGVQGGSAEVPRGWNPFAQLGAYA